MSKTQSKIKAQKKYDKSNPPIQFRLSKPEREIAEQKFQNLNLTAKKLFLAELKKEI